MLTGSSDSWFQVEKPREKKLEVGKTVPLHTIPNRNTTYSKNFRSLGLITLCLGKSLDELLFSEFLPRMIQGPWTAHGGFCPSAGPAEGGPAG